MFAFLFDESHPDMPGVFGAACASSLIRALQGLNPPPSTHVLVGGLLISSLAYRVKQIEHKARTANAPSWRGGTTSQAMEGDKDHFVTLICDLAETLSTNSPGLSESELLGMLGRLKLWTIVLPEITVEAAIEAHRDAGAFGPYKGFVKLDGLNPLHRRLFFEYLFKGRYLDGTKMYFRAEDDAENWEPTEDYGAANSYVLPSDEFDRRVPRLSLPTQNSERGELSATRAAGRDPVHRERLAHDLATLANGDAIDFIFSANKPDDRPEFSVDPRKLTHYALELQHPKGGPKAAFFRDTLAIAKDDWRYLADQLIQGARIAAPYRLAITEREFVHGALVRVTGRNGRQAVVETGWKLQAAGPAELVTVYPANAEVGADVPAVVGRVPPLEVVGPARLAAIYALADAAGRDSGNALRPTPMVLEQYGTVWEGMCGFAWVHLPNARKPFAKWLADQGLAYKSYPGVRMFSKLETQSMEMNEAYAHAFAEVLRINDIECTVGSRLD